YRKRLALGELEGAAGLRAAVLLALHHASVAGEEAALLEQSAKLRFVEGERAGDAVAHGTGLAREAAAGDGGDDIVLAAAVRRFDGLLQVHLKNRPGEILGELLVVHRDLAGARLHPNAGDGVLALAGGVGAAMSIELLHMDRSGGLLRCFA